MACDERLVDHEHRRDPDRESWRISRARHNGCHRSSDKEERSIHMKRIMSCSTFAILAALAAVAPAGAATVIDQRQENQERRIDQGIQSGQLTGPEAERLQRQQNRIETMESKAQADGKVSAAERRKIRRAQNRASRRIWREKHDAQTR